MIRISRIENIVIAGISAIFALSMLVCFSHAAIDTESVVGVWLLNDDKNNTAVDSSGNGHDGEIKGAPEIDEGKFGDAFTFNGSGDFIDCGNAETLNLETFTVAFWAKFPTNQGWNHIVSKGSHVASGTPGSVNWGVMMRSGEARFLFEIFEDVTWTGISSPAVPLDEWQHLAATYDGATMNFLLNGASLGTQAGVVVELDPERSFRIGGIATAGATPGNFFNGSVDDVILLDEALPVADIQTLMNNGTEEALKLTAVSPAGKAASTWAEIKASY